MGRKSKVAERTNQILDAFEKCIIAHGFEGATLQRTADLAQVNLGMIHHYIGRKDDLLKSMVTRLIGRTQEEITLFHNTVRPERRLPFLLDLFFGSDVDDTDKIIDALYLSGSENPLVQTALDDINRLYLSILQAEIAVVHPQLPAARCHEVALSVLALAYGRELLPSGQERPDLWRMAAETLIQHPEANKRKIS